MHPNGRFLRDQNVRRYFKTLITEPDRAERARLSALLVAEEDRFASRRERLERVELLIRDAEARIVKLDRLFQDDDKRAPIADYAQVMASHTRTLGLLCDYRRLLVEAMERNRR